MGIVMTIRAVVEFGTMGRSGVAGGAFGHQILPVLLGGVVGMILGVAAVTL